ncbi:hypothetical protein AVEN_16195-1 [Araneus ventricosus]|uniref:Uncharacterized protein n=1 Tax=Araneus ventricosus TaxID=182803 RepID=A0A4Y2TGS8_ARAVE|nr:hypothetical protein AVEN_16195-1 [Araneus ventricosus]
MKSSHRSGRVRWQTHGCQSAHSGTDTWEHWTILPIHLCSTGLYCPNDTHLLKPLKKTLTDEDTETEFPSLFHRLIYPKVTSSSTSLQFYQSDFPCGIQFGELISHRAAPA